MKFIQNYIEKIIDKKLREATIILNKQISEFIITYSQKIDEIHKLEKKRLELSEKEVSESKSYREKCLSIEKEKLLALKGIIIHVGGPLTVGLEE